VENVRAYLSSHARLRVALLCLAFFSASVALYLGAFIYAFMNSPAASMHPLRDRSVAAAYLITALILNVLMVWAMGRAARPRSVWARCGLSIGGSVGGAASIYVLIWGRYLLLGLVIKAALRSLIPQL
jgi:hypothetical protein